MASETVALRDMPFYDLPDGKELLGRVTDIQLHQARGLLVFDGAHYLEFALDERAYPPPPGWEENKQPKFVLHIRQLGDALLAVVLVCESQYDVWIRGCWFARQTGASWTAIADTDPRVTESLEAFAVLTALKHEQAPF